MKKVLFASVLIAIFSQGFSQGLALVDKEEKIISSETIVTIPTVIEIKVS